MTLTLAVKKHDGTVKRFRDVVRFEEADDGVWVEFTDESEKPPLDIAGAEVGHGVLER